MAKRKALRQWLTIDGLSILYRGAERKTTHCKSSLEVKTHGKEGYQDAGPNFLRSGYVRDLNACARLNSFGLGYVQDLSTCGC